MAKSRPYEETLNEMLARPEDAAEYLNAALEDGDPAVFLLALKDVANVHGGIGRLAEAAELNRESMYRMVDISPCPASIRRRPATSRQPA